MTHPHRSRHANGRAPLASELTYHRCRLFCCTQRYDDNMKIRFAVSAGIGQQGPKELSELVTGAEERGFDTLWFSSMPTLPSTDPMVAVPFAAAVSTRLKLGVHLVPFGYEPYVFAHQVAQLDRLSGGRLLLALVPGLGQPMERSALGIQGRHRGHMLDALVPRLRQLWSGDAGESGEKASPSRLPILPIQSPLELWLGGTSDAAVHRAARLADGWLGSLVAPAEAGDIRTRIRHEAAMSGRTIDPGHFGLSIRYARHADDIHKAEMATQPRHLTKQEAIEMIPVGSVALRDLIGRLVDQGLSKFVVRPIWREQTWSNELDWLATALLDLQT